LLGGKAKGSSKGGISPIDSGRMERRPRGVGMGENSGKNPISGIRKVNLIKRWCPRGVWGAGKIGRVPGRTESGIAKNISTGK